MARSLWLFNLLLALLAVVLIGALVSSISDRESPSGGQQEKDSRQQAAGPQDSGLLRSSRQQEKDSGQQASEEAPEAEGGDRLRASAPPISDFDVIVQRDVFKNLLAETLRSAPAVRRPPPPPPLPPLPTLVGTIFVGEERKAVLTDGSRTEIFTLGQPVAGGTLVKIEADRVTIKRGETSAEVMLRASIQQVKPSGIPDSTIPEAGENGPQGEGSPPSVPTPPVSSAPSMQPSRKEQVIRELQQRLTTPQDRLRQLRERAPLRRQLPQGQ